MLSRSIEELCRIVQSHRKKFDEMWLFILIDRITKNLYNEKFINFCSKFMRDIMRLINKQKNS